MHVIVAVVCRRARLTAKRILHHPLIVRHLVYEPLFQKGFQGPINRNPIQGTLDFFVNIRMGNCKLPLHKKAQNKLAHRGHAQFKFIQDRVYLSHLGSIVINNTLDNIYYRVPKYHFLPSLNSIPA